MLDASKTVLITGGSRGIGAAAVKKFAEKGWQVAFLYKEQDRAAMEVAEETGALPIRCDVTDRESLRESIKAARVYFGVPCLDAVVCNAGISISGLFTDMTEDQWDLLLRTNLEGAMYTAKYALPDMIRNEKGSIILVSSMWGETGGSYEVAYSTTKAALIGFGKSLAKEVGPSGVRVNIVAPGVIDTDMCRMYDEDVIDGLVRDVPLCRIGKGEDVASAICFLADEESSYVTGQVLGVSGGFYI